MIEILGGIMEDNRCERCGKASFGMTILTHCNNEQETICTDCFNKEMAEFYGVDDFKDYIKTYTAVDSEGVAHTFDINKRIMGTGVFWEAVEVNDGKYNGYQFEVQVDMDGDQHEAVQKLYNKISKGLLKKNIEVKSYDGHKIYSMADDEIVGRIEWDDTEPQEHVPVFIIDGKKYSLQELGKIMISHEGFNFKLKLYDLTEDVE
jgi:hypothetical protein